MLLSVETLISPLHRSGSNFSSLPFFPLSSNCDSVYGSNLANRSHIVPLIKFNDSAATSGVWADSERGERENKRGGEGWRTGSFFSFFFFFKVAQKVSVEGRGEKEPANTPTLPLLL